MGNPTENLQGLALVASPYLTDQNFLRSVVYMLNHDADGAMGLILNRPTNVSIQDLLDQLAEKHVDNDSPVYCGGPVDGMLTMLQSVEINERCLIACATDQDRILTVCEENRPDHKYRVFDGYAGWGPGQLEAELQGGGWITWDLNPEDVFSDPDEIWQMAIHRIGRDILAGGIDISKMQQDPACN